MEGWLEWNEKAAKDEIRSKEEVQEARVEEEVMNYGVKRIKPQGRNDDNLMFDTGFLDEQEVEVEKIKAAKPKVRRVMIQEPSEFTTTTTTTTTPAASKPSQDKGKGKMIESEKPLKKKDQIMYDQEVALNLQAELEEEERLTIQKEEETNIALIESWDNTQAMMDADYQMAQQLQVEEQEQLSIE
ncbi:hypothetical protein Tco_1509148 [Tanacetum coccineum]